MTVLLKHSLVLLRHFKTDYYFFSENFNLTCVFDRGESSSLIKLVIIGITILKKTKNTATLTVQLDT